ncbi:conserved hypothetical protein, partial [Ixodes scapularis]
PTTITFLVTNCRSIKNKIDDLSSLMDTVKPSVVTGTGSWQVEEATNREVFPSHFTCYSKDRYTHGGGVFILADQCISSRTIGVDEGSCEAVWCQLRLRDDKAQSVCSFYRPPASS